MRCLYLDDARPCPPGFDLVRSYAEFVAYIEANGVPDFISFDHDLADEHYPWNDPSFESGNLAYDAYKEKTGFHCAKYLVDQELPLPTSGWKVHSMNVVGRENIEKLLEGYQRHLAQATT